MLDDTPCMSLIGFSEGFSVLDGETIKVIGLLTFSGEMSQSEVIEFEATDTEERGMEEAVTVSSWDEIVLLFIEDDLSSIWLNFTEFRED